MAARKGEGFLAAVRNALKHYTDPKWLGTNSPLAKPYFLGKYLERVEGPEEVSGQGRALQQLLFQAAIQQWPGELPASRDTLHHLVTKEQAEIGNGGPQFLFLILELRYFRHFYPSRTPPTTVGTIYDYLLISESAFFRYLSRATELLADNLLNLARPNLRLEQPILTASLVGRDSLIERTLQELQQGRSVSFSGVGGIGKTSLATAVANAWSTETFFWYTFRPGLNDDLASLLFSLGHFLHGLGHSNLWLQLITNEDTIIEIPQAIGFLLEDLYQSEKNAFLFCFDEVDLLHTERSQPRHGVHKQLLELIEGLRNLVPLLLVGQRALIDTTAHYVLQPLTSQEIGTIFKHNDHTLSTSECKKILRFTEGNPRIIELYLMLLQAGQPPEQINLRHAPAIKPLFHRLWRRLSTDEKHLLMSLSVFRAHVPQDEWQGTDGYQALQRRHLLKLDAYGGVTLLPIFRELVYDELTADQRSSAHNQAASIRATRGQHTSTAFHLVKAGDVETAVRYWFAHQDSEISSGSAGAAYAIFTALHRHSLSATTTKLLKLIQNRLHLAYGEAESVLADMENYSWHIEDELSPQFTAQGMQQWAEAHFHLGEYDAALLRFDEALALLGRLSRQMVNLYANGRGRVWLHQSHFQEAEREALIAQFELKHFQIRLKIARGQLQEAQKIGVEALALASDIGDERKVSLIHYYLATASGNLGDISTAKNHANQVFVICERIGDRLLLENMRAELAGFYLNVGRFADVIEPAEQALTFFEKIKNDLRLPYIYSNLAEAYYELEHLEQAEQYAFKARQSENPRIQPYACYTLGLIYKAKKKHQAAEDMFQFGLQIATQTEDKFIAAYLHREYGSFLMELDRSKEGLLHLQTALNLFTELNIPHEIDKTQSAIAAY